MTQPIPKDRLAELIGWFSGPFHKRSSEDTFSDYLFTEQERDEVAQALRHYAQMREALEDARQTLAFVIGDNDEWMKIGEELLRNPDFGIAVRNPEKFGKDISETMADLEIRKQIAQKLRALSALSGSQA